MAASVQPKLNQHMTDKEPAKYDLCTNFLSRQTTFDAWTFIDIAHNNKHVTCAEDIEGYGG